MVLNFAGAINILKLVLIGFWVKTGPMVAILKITKTNLNLNLHALISEMVRDGAKDKILDHMHHQ